MTAAKAVTHPSIGVGGVLIHKGRVLLIRRGKKPLRGRWVVPGGTVELGETLEEALVREMKEETGLRVRTGEMLTLFERIERRGGRVRYHFVIADYLCHYRSGTPRAGSDAEALAFVRPKDLPAYRLPKRALQLVHAAFRRLAP